LTTWHDLAGTQRTRSTTWDVAGLVSGQRDASWSVLTSFTVLRTTLWVTGVQVLVTRATRWQVIGHLVLLRSTRWNVEQLEMVCVLFPTTVAYYGDQQMVALYEGSVKMWEFMGGSNGQSEVRQLESADDERLVRLDV
jgi:hypothetical protein